MRGVIKKGTRYQVKSQQFRFSHYWKNVTHLYEKWYTPQITWCT